MYLVVVDVTIDGKLVESTAWERQDNEINAHGIFELTNRIRTGYAKNNGAAVIVPSVTGIYPIPEGV